MEAIKIKGTEDTPNVILDAAENLMEISGRSLPEDVSSFYGLILNWLADYVKSPNPKTVFNFKLVYFNTASSKLILDILMKLKGHLPKKEMMFLLSGTILKMMRTCRKPVMNMPILWKSHSSKYLMPIEIKPLKKINHQSITYVSADLPIL